MRSKAVIFMLLVPYFGIGSPTMAGDDAQTDHEAVIQAAMDYALGVASHDRERIEKAFALNHAQLKLVESKDEREVIREIPISEVLEKIWLKLPKTPDAKVSVRHLLVVEGKMASILIDNNGQFLDLLSLYKVDGRWRIVDKLAIRHPDASPLKIDLDTLLGLR